MKRTIKLLALAAVFTVFAVPALAQTKECNDEFKSATYSKWYDNRTKDQPAAYQAAEEYLAVCPNDESPYKTAIKKFYDAYKAETEKISNKKQFDEAFQKKNYAEQIRLGKLILANEPDNVVVIIVMGLAGLGEPNLMGESAPHARKAIELITAGKPFTPLPSKDAALAYLNYVLAKSTVKSDPTAAIPHFLDAARFESDLKKNPLIYNEIAAAYGEGPVAKLSDDYKKFIGQAESTESKLALANLNLAIDRQIDAFARAAALSTNPTDKKAVMDVLTGLYKDRNNQTETGLPELVASVLTKPLPDLPKPLTSLPTPPAPTAPVNPGSQASSSTGTTATTGTKVGNTGNGNGTSTGTGSAGKASGSAKPAASPTPGKKPRVNYRRG